MYARPHSGKSNRIDPDYREPSPSAGWRVVYAVLDVPLGVEPRRVAA